MNSRLISTLSALLVLLVVLLTASFSPSQAQSVTSLPTAFIQVPASGSQAVLGQPLVIDVVAQDAEGITYIELTQNGRLLQRVQNPQGSSPQWRAWVLTEAAPLGVVSYEVRAYRGNLASAPAVLQLSVVAEASAVSRAANLPVELPAEVLTSASCQVVILSDASPIQIQADSTSEVLGQASLGQVLPVQTGIGGQWWQVALEGQAGWVADEYSATLGDCRQYQRLQGCRASVTGQAASLRTDPDPNASILFSLPAATTWDAVSQSPGWLELDVEGATGWASLDEVTLLDGCPVEVALAPTLAPSINLPPVISPIPNQTLSLGQSVTIPVSASDPEGYNTTIAGVESGSDQVASVTPDGQGNLIVTAVSAGQVNIFVSVDDGLGGITTTQFAVLVLQPTDPVNQPPLVEALPDIRLGYNAQQTLQVVASDPEGFNPYLESIVSSADTIASVENIGNRQIRVTAISPGRAQITVTVADGQGGLTSVTFRAEVQQSPSPTPNLPPQVQPVPDQVVGVGQTVTVFVQAVDPEGFFPFFSSVESSATTIVTAQADGEGNIQLVGVSPGQARVDFVLDDANGGQTRLGFAVQVQDFSPPAANANLPPRIEPIAAQVVRQGEFLPLQLQIQDPEGQPISLSVSSTSPSTVAAQVEDGNITLFGQGEGSATITVVASDSEGQSAAVVFPATVQAEAVSGVDVAVLPSLPQWSLPTVTTLQTLYANGRGDVGALVVLGDTLPTQLAGTGGEGTISYLEQPILEAIQAEYSASSAFNLTVATNPAWKVADLLNPANASAECGESVTPVMCLVVQGQPSLAVLFIGRNDALAQTPLGEFRANLNAVLDDLLSNNVIPLLVTIPGESTLVMPYNQVIAQVAAERTLPLWNLWASVPSANVNPDDLTLTVPSTGPAEALALSAAPQFGASQRNVELWNVLTGLRLALGLQ